MNAGQPNDKSYNSEWGYMFRKPKKEKSNVPRKERKRLKSLKNKIK